MHQECTPANTTALICSFIHSIAQVRSSERVVLYGAGTIAESLQKSSLQGKIVRVVDGDPSKHGLVFHGFTIESPDILGERHEDFDTIFITARTDVSSIVAQLRVILGDHFVEKRLLPEESILFDGNDREDGRRFSVDFDKFHIDIIKKVEPYTITSHERIYALVESVRYILRNDIGGDFVECGVYKGGSIMAIALTLMAEGVIDRNLYCFDTFEGMPTPEERDIDAWGIPAIDYFSQKDISDVNSGLNDASLDRVRQTVSSTGYPMDKIHFVKGLVEDTIPENAPESIALLRLDTDYYKSTMHEMVNLFPRISKNGIAIIDDYGHFKGAKDAVDEYFNMKNIFPFLHRIDYTGRLIIKK